jgi:hypothetical protein
MTLNKRHDNCVPILIDWGGGWETCGVKSVHVLEFLLCCNTANIQPVVQGTVLQVVTIGLDRSERGPPKSSEFHHSFIAIRIKA